MDEGGGRGGALGRLQRANIGTNATTSHRVKANEANVPDVWLGSNDFKCRPPFLRPNLISLQFMCPLDIITELRTISTLHEAKTIHFIGEYWPVERISNETMNECGAATSWEVAGWSTRKERKRKDEAEGSRGGGNGKAMNDFHSLGQGFAQGAKEMDGPAAADKGIQSI
ncbi:hypothetical protein GPALN_012884 [Globodera pallida]|nr:hypothetical protein GPALN_012884 [Globodera pallida]